ncbi:hypothetical protein Tco_1563066, partial [Tanacetum coccineum]
IEDKWVNTSLGMLIVKVALELDTEPKEPAELGQVNREPAEVTRPLIQCQHTPRLFVQSNRMVIGCIVEADEKNLCSASSTYLVYKGDLKPRAERNH